ncbi:MAG: LysE family transporter [Cyanobacteria bacterium J06632_3]
MLHIVFGRGLLMGVAIAAPVGPIGLLCIRRTIDRGRWVGIASGCGAATADGVYGAIAAFGLTAISTFLVEYTLYLRVIGGLFLCYLGLSTFFAASLSATTSLSASGSEEIQLQKANWVGAYTSTFALTLTNPATIFSFLAIFAGLGITQTAYLTSVTLVFGVFTGSVLWWLVLVSGVAHLRRRLTPQRLIRFNRWSSRVFGVLILGFGIAALLA